jgi:hypothetical protein
MRFKNRNKIVDLGSVIGQMMIGTHWAKLWRKMTHKIFTQVDTKVKFCDPQKNNKCLCGSVGKTIRFANKSMFPAGLGSNVDTGQTFEW